MRRCGSCRLRDDWRRAVSYVVCSSLAPSTLPIHVACGIVYLQKPLTIHFLEKAKEAYVYSTQKDRMFSPSFDDIERSPGLAVGGDRSGFDGIVPYIDHSLGE